MATAAQAGVVVDGRFVLEAEHRRGGMGTIWRARDLREDRRVAVKILHGGATVEAQRFVREAELLAQLADGHIVAYVAHGRTDAGMPYLVMEWLDGENLAERLARRPLRLHETLAIVGATARALAAAHERGVIHRDVKPSNLFLRGGRVDDVVVLDLGIARLAASGGGEALTRAGAILGTPSYMAPEQAQGAGQITPAADVFSLGCVLHECLVGAPPFSGTHVLTVLTKVLFENPPRVREWRPELPGALDDLCTRMLAKRPSQRPADAAAVLAELARIEGVADVAAPGEDVRVEAVPVVPPAAAAELELVSLILATPGSPGGAPAAAAAAGSHATDETLTADSLPDVAAYGGELRRLADASAVITLPQRRGAATDLAVRAARLALRVRENRPGWSVVLATGPGLAHARYVGEVADRAAALVRAHPAGGAGVWLDPVTAGLLDARFQLTHGPGDDVRLDGEDASIDPARPLLGRPTACVGREHELGSLELALRACIDESSPHATLVVGQPGMGKTRLRHELVRRLATHADLPQVEVLLALADPLRSASAVGLLGRALARLAGVRSGADEAEQRARLDERLGRHVPASERARTVGLLGELCGVAFPLDDLPEVRTARQDPRHLARLVDQAWLTFLRAEAAAAPLLVVLDDLQWADAASVALVDLALRELGGSPIMVLALARPEVHEIHPDLWRSRVAVLPLRPLAPAITARFVRQVLGEGLDHIEVERLVARAAGNALYLEELIRAADAHHDAVPETVLAMLQARIGLLPAPTRRVLRAASVLGDSFAHAAVEALVPGPGDDLAVLARHEILESHAAGWRFRHVLMKDAAYGLLPDEERRSLHARAALYFAGVAEDPALVGTHFELGGDPAAAVPYFVAAAELAFRRGDHAAIRAFVERGRAAGARGAALGILRGLEAPTLFFRSDLPGSWAATQESLALLPPGHPRRPHTLAAATFCGIQIGKLAEVAPLVAELTATDPGDMDPGGYVAALGWATLTYIVLGRRRESSQLIERIAAIDARHGGRDPVVNAQLSFWRQRFLDILGDDPHAALELARAAYEENGRVGNRRLQVNSLAAVGETTRWLHGPHAAEPIFRETVAQAFELGEPITTQYVCQFLINVVAVHGRDDQQDEVRRLAEICMAPTPPGSLYRGLSHNSLALLALRAGDLDGAESYARSARETMRHLGMAGVYAHVDGTLLQVLLRRVAAGGAIEAAVAVAEEALANVETRGPCGFQDVPVRALVARVFRAAGRDEEARRVAVAAQAALDRQRSRFPEAAGADLRRAFLEDVPEHAEVLELASWAE